MPMTDTVDRFLDFVLSSPTAFHAVDQICETLLDNGFVPLRENTPWHLEPGRRYYVTRNRSSVIAFTVPEKGFAHFQIVASHSDSPVFKLKPATEETVCGKYTRLNAEGYGGMIMSTWFDRPLSIAGRVIVKDGDKLTTQLADLQRDAAMICNMPIHFNRDANSGYKYNAQVDMLPIIGDAAAKDQLMKDIAECCETTPDKIAACDLFLYPRGPVSIWGNDDCFFSCPRIDDLECAWTSVEAFVKEDAVDHINMCAVFDNEEVGSSTKQGAAGTFLNDVMTRIGFALGANEPEIRAAMAGSFMVSADNAHAVHPNHPEKYDADNRVYMNGGVVIKHNANQKYTTDGVSDAIFSAVCEKAGVPVQHFANRSDLPGGSTLGNIANTQVSMNTVDIGLAQLAMHSACETAGSKDVDYMINALRAFYATDIAVTDDGSIELK